jgi:hypothetical protein
MEHLPDDCVAEGNGNQTAYQGQTEVIRQVAPQARDMTSRRTRYKHGADEV